MPFPRARVEQLIIQELADETLVFDRKSQKGHCLNRTTALVWKHCDGRTELSDLARLVEPDLGIATAEVLVQLALEQLASRNLLDEGFERISATQRRSRREVLKRLAAAAVAMPLILTVTAPRADAAASPFCSGKKDGTVCGNGLQICCSGNCCGAGQACQVGFCCIITGACKSSSQCCSGSCIAGQCVPNPGQAET